MTKIIAILGGIASGKSTVVDRLKYKGAVAIHADNINKEEVLVLPEIYEQLRARWQIWPLYPAGDGFQSASKFGGSLPIRIRGELQYQNIAQIIFNNPEELEFVQDITRPFVVKRILNLVDIYNNRYHKVIVIDAPMLLELNLPLSPDIYFVDCPDAIRMRRYIDRCYENTNGLDTKLPDKLKRDVEFYKKDFLRREQNQISLEEKKNKSKGIIDNSIDGVNSLKLLKSQVDALWTTLTSE